MHRVSPRLCLDLPPNLWLPFANIGADEEEKSCLDAGDPGQGLSFSQHSAYIPNLDKEPKAQRTGCAIGPCGVERLAGCRYWGGWLALELFFQFLFIRELSGSTAVPGRQPKEPQTF